MQLSLRNAVVIIQTRVRVLRRDGRAWRTKMSSVEAHFQILTHPIVGTVCITSSESFCNLFKMVVFPALSRPRIKIRHSLFPNIAEKDWIIREKSSPLCRMWYVSCFSISTSIQVEYKPSKLLFVLRRRHITNFQKSNISPISHNMVQNTGFIHGKGPMHLRKLIHLRLSSVCMLLTPPQANDSEFDLHF